MVYPHHLQLTGHFFPSVLKYFPIYQPMPITLILIIKSSPPLLSLNGFPYAPHARYIEAHIVMVSLLLHPDGIYVPSIPPQVGGAAKLSLKLESVSEFAFSFYIFIASTGATPSDIYFMKNPQVKIHYSTAESEILDINVCGT